MRLTSAALAAFFLTASALSAMAAEKMQNRLASEKSPYLLKHAANPVDWYPWGEEAFERAKKEDKPVFLSIGYSTCHWCNVMEEESFSDPEVAALMNEAFVSVKVDREERPDIDNVYMAVSIMLTGGGGWPLTVVMTPERKPFFAGTYFPKHSRYNRIGMMELIPRIQEVWREKRAEVLTSANTITENLARTAAQEEAEALGEKDLHAAYRELAEHYDEEHGGFGEAPKFPAPHKLLFLLRYWRRTGETHALEMVERSLQRMRRGGVYDHLGHGFHRYSTDAEWLVPHFEKMLYDQALLALAYVEAFQATGKEEYARTAREIFSYVLRDMTSPEGGFYSAESADSEGEEGKFYVWGEEEVREVLGEEAGLALGAYGVRAEGNFVDPLKGERTGENILWTARTAAEVAEDLGVPVAEAAARLEEARRKLFDHREMRVRPDRDDKVLTDWNGLMIAAMARGAQVLGDEAYLLAARRAADFVLGEMRDGKGRLLHRWRGGSAGIRAGADDYAYLLWGLLELYETEFEPANLKAALGLAGEFVEEFWDEEAGGFFFTADTGETLIVRMKEIYDGASPSANSVGMLTLGRLGRLTARTDLEEKAEAIGRVFAAQVRESPSAHTMLMTALDFSVGPAFEVVIAGEEGEEDTEALLKALRRAFVPRKVVVFLPNEGERQTVLELVPYAEDMGPVEGKAAAYVCSNYACKLPVTDADAMLDLLGRGP